MFNKAPIARKGLGALHDLVVQCPTCRFRTAIAKHLVCVEVHSDIPVDLFLQHKLLWSDAQKAMQTDLLFVGFTPLQSSTLWTSWHCIPPPTL
jgi:hypothetical protein